MRQSYFIVAAVLVLSSFLSTDAKAISLTDIDFFVGTGPNQVAMVLDWADGKDPLIWGYRWDGVATARDMFHDIVAADTRLFAKVSNQFSFGEFIYGIGYDRDADGFVLSDSTDFVNGLFEGSATDGATATDPDDSYREGFDFGFWGFFIASGNPYDGGVWGFANFGISDTVLVNDQFLGFSFAPDLVGDVPGEPATVPSASPAPIPEPGTIIMLGFSVMGLMLRRRVFVS